MPATIEPINATHLKALVDEAIRMHGPYVDLNHIDVSRINDFKGLFKDTAFTGNISLWDTRSAGSFASMFENCPFNGDISKWNTAKVWYMTDMFNNSSFNSDISDWDTRSLVDMSRMFCKSPFNGDLSRWNVKRVQNAIETFRACDFNGDLSQWRMPELQLARFMFYASAFNGDVSQWGANKLTQAQSMFEAHAFQQSLSNWLLPSRCNFAKMVHSAYQNVLPRIETEDPSIHATVFNACYANMLGGPGVLQDYLKTTEFSRVHADLLIEYARECTWAAPQTIAWAKEQITLGTSMGLSRVELNDLMVAQYKLRSEPAMPVDNRVFESFSEGP